MPNEQYEFRFRPDVPLEEVSDSLRLAALACEGMYGSSGVHLDARHEICETRRTCTIDAQSRIGQSLARIFRRFLAAEFGAAAFSVVLIRPHGTGAPGRPDPLEALFEPDMDANGGHGGIA